MQQRRMPGFTAEVAIGPATRPFPSGRRPRRPPGTAVTAQLLVLDQRRECDPSCVCVTGEGCPCCYSLETTRTRTTRTIRTIRTMRARSGQRRRRI